MKIYLGGIIQSSRTDNGMVNQDYREELKKILNKKYLNPEIYCPIEQSTIKDPNDLSEIKSHIHKFLDYIKTCDLLIGYMPVASNGTSIELFYAWQNKVPTIVISPMSYNWALLTFADKICKDIEDFESYINTLK